MSEVNKCVYCKSVYIVIGKMNGFTDEQLPDIRREKTENPKMNALVKFAASIIRNRGNAEATLVDDFYAKVIPMKI